MAGTIAADMPDQVLEKLWEEFNNAVYHWQHLPPHDDYTHEWISRMDCMVEEFERFWDLEQEMTLGQLHKVAYDWYRVCDEFYVLNCDCPMFNNLWMAIDRLGEAVEYSMPMPCGEGCRGWGEWGYGCPDCEEW